MNFANVESAERWARDHKPYEAALREPSSIERDDYVRRYGSEAWEIREQMRLAVLRGEDHLLFGFRGLSRKLSFALSKNDPRFYEDRKPREAP